MTQKYPDDIMGIYFREDGADMPRKTKEPTKTEPTLRTIVQANGREIDVTNIAADALKAYKSVHKRKVVSDFVIYVKPEENAAYFTINGEGSDDYKINL